MRRQACFRPPSNSRPARQGSSMRCALLVYAKKSGRGLVATGNWGRLPAVADHMGRVGHPAPLARVDCRILLHDARGRHVQMCTRAASLPGSWLQRPEKSSTTFCSLQHVVSRPSPCVKLLFVPVAGAGHRGFRAQDLQVMIPAPLEQAMTHCPRVH